MTASPWPIPRASLRTFVSETGAGVLNESWLPPLKSIPRFKPLKRRAPSEIATIVPEIANHSRRLPMKSTFNQLPIPRPRAPINVRLSIHENSATSVSNARVNKTAVSIEIAVPISSISAKPFTLAVATANRTNAVIAVTTFASMIVWKPRW